MSAANETSASSADVHDELAARAFSRATGAQLIDGNQINLLRDAAENYPVWLDSIRGATRYIHFENYIICDDEVGGAFIDALIAKAREGVRVRLLYDWFGSLGKHSHALWPRLREAGVEVRCHNRPQFIAPLGWVSRNHRKTIVVDGKIGIVSGLCVGRAWTGDAAAGIEPWRDSGVLVLGPAVTQIERAFAAVWAIAGTPIPEEPLPREASDCEGAAKLRVIATSPGTSGVFRVDQLVAALARRRLWLADAYYAGTPAYVQALSAAARDGVDVRLLVPGASDIPLLKPLSRACYRPLLRAGVRVFEWNGSMMHAKTAVADGRWARVGSSNLNIASWFGNHELDIVAEDVGFARTMEDAYLRDLERATELHVDCEQHEKQPAHARKGPRRGRGSGLRALTGLAHIGNAVGATIFSPSNNIEPLEPRSLFLIGLIAFVLAAGMMILPGLIAYPVAAFICWIALALMYRACQRSRRRALLDGNARQRHV